MLGPNFISVCRGAQRSQGPCTRLAGMGAYAPIFRVVHLLLSTFFNDRELIRPGLLGVRT